MLIQPRRIKRPFIALTFSGRRTPVTGLISPVREPLLTAAEAAIDHFVAEGLFGPIGKRHHYFRVRLTNPAQLDRYLHTAQVPPRFPAGARQRLVSLWKSRSPGTLIEVTEFMTVIALRAVERGDATATVLAPPVRLLTGGAALKATGRAA
jgi:hypothetical protein